MTYPDIAIAVNSDLWPSETTLAEMSKSAVSTTAKVASLKWQEGAELSILFTNDYEVQKLNKEWRSINKPTNVLSFPSEDLKVGEGAGLIIGDIVLAYETIENEAREQNKSFDQHLTHLLIHGFLHLFGYDHLNNEEAGQMESLEIEILSALDIENPYAQPN